MPSNLKQKLEHRHFPPQRARLFQLVAEMKVQEIDPLGLRYPQKMSLQSKRRRVYTRD